LSCKPYSEKESTENGTPVDCTYSLPNLAKINQFILQSPNDAKLFRIRSQILLDSGRFEESLSDAKRALSINSDDLYNYVVVAKSHRALGHIDSALSACITAEKEGFNDPDNFLLLGDLYLIIRQYGRSLDYLNKALKLAPFEPRIYYLKGVLFWEQGDTTKALSSWQTSIEQDASFGDGYARLATFYMNKNDYGTAEQYLRSGIRLKPDDAFLHYDMGVFLNFKGYPDSAIAAYEKSLELDNKLYQAKENLAYLLYRKGNYQKAIPLLESAREKDGKNSILLYYLGSSYQFNGEYEKAIELLTLVVNLNRDFVKEAQNSILRAQKLKTFQKRDTTKIIQ
jgi:tetratricopeptide (TPR) repeat protein